MPPDGPLSVLHALASEPTLARHSEEALLMTAADDLAVVRHGDGYGMHLTCSLISSAPGTSIANGRGVETCTTSEAACPSGSRFNAISMSNRCWPLWRHPKAPSAGRRRPRGSRRGNNHSDRRADDGSATSSRRRQSSPDGPAMPWRPASGVAWRPCPCTSRSGPIPHSWSLSAQLRCHRSNYPTGSRLAARWC